MPQRSYGDDLTTEERKTITSALNYYSTALLSSAKKLTDLGKTAVANKLTKDAGAISRELVPMYDDQASLAIEDIPAKKEPRNRGLLLTDGGTKKEAAT